MVKKCCVKNCLFRKSHPKDKISYHRFPTTNAELLQKWIDFLDYGDDWKPTKYMYICSSHFLPSSFTCNTNLPRLKWNAVPSVKCTEADKTDNNIIIDLDIYCNDIVNETIGDVNKTCRLCGNEYNSKLFYIFETDFVSRIHRCFHLLISKDDLLPMSICKMCKLNIENIEKLLMKLEEVQIRLSKKFCKMNEMEVDDLTCENIEETKSNTIIVEKPIENIENSDNIIIFNITNDNIENNTIYLEEDNSIPNHQFIYNDNIVSDYRNVKDCDVSVLDEFPLKIQIKKEIMTPCPEKEVQNVKPVTNVNKKIEILEDIKIDPIQIDFKSIKPRCEDKILHIENITCPINEPEILTKRPAKKVKVRKNLKVSNILSASTIICNYCGDKFISKCALNHHVKYLCNKKCNINNKQTIKINKQRIKFKK